MPISHVLPDDVVLRVLSRLTSCKSTQRVKNSLMWSTDTTVSGLIFKIQALSLIASRTFQFFLEDAS